MTIKEILKELKNDAEYIGDRNYPWVGINMKKLKIVLEKAIQEARDEGYQEGMRDAHKVIGVKIPKDIRFAKLQNLNELQDTLSLFHIKFLKKKRKGEFDGYVGCEYKKRAIEDLTLNNK